MSIYTSLARIAVAVAVRGPLGGVGATIGELVTRAEPVLKQHAEAKTLQRTVAAAVRTWAAAEHLSDQDSGLRRAALLVGRFGVTEAEMAEQAYDARRIMTLVIDRAEAAGSDQLRPTSDPAVVVARRAVEFTYDVLLKHRNRVHPILSGIRQGLRQGEKLMTVVDGNAALLHQLGDKVEDLRDLFTGGGPGLEPSRPPTGAVPWSPDPLFTCSPELLGAVVELLQVGSDVAVPPVALTGIPGQGKTALAMHLGATLGPDLSGVPHVVSGSSREQLVAGLARTLGHAPEPVPGPTARDLPGTSRTLLIIDGVQDRSVLTGILPASSQLRILLTTTVDDLGEHVRHVPVTSWGRDETARYLGKVWPACTDQEAAELTRRLAGHPLAISQAANYCTRTGASAAEYLALLEEAPRVALAAGEDRAYPSSTLQAIDLTLDDLEGRDPLAYLLVCLTSVLGDSPLPLDVLMAEHPVAAFMTHVSRAPAPEVLDAFAARGLAMLAVPGAVRAAAFTLVRALLSPRRPDGALEVHQLFRLVAKGRATDHPGLQTLAASIFLLPDDDRTVDPSLSARPDLLPHLTALVEDCLAAGTWGVAVQFFALAANEYLTIAGEEARCERLQQAMLGWLHSIPRHDGTRSMHVVTELGVARTRAIFGHFDDALEMLRPALDDYFTGDEDFRLDVAPRLAEVLSVVRDRTTSRAVLDALPASAVDDVPTGLARARLLYVLDEYEEAQQLLTTLAARESESTKDLQVAVAALLGSLAHLADDHRSALAQYETVLAGVDRTGLVDPAGPEVHLHYQLQAAEALLGDQRLDEAEERLGRARRALDQMEVTEEEPRAAPYRAVVGWLHLERAMATSDSRHLHIAAEALEGAVDAFATLPLSRQRPLSSALYHLAMVRLVGGDLGSARPLAARALELDERTFGEGTPGAARARELVSILDGLARDHVRLDLTTVSTLLRGDGPS